MTPGSPHVPPTPVTAPAPSTRVRDYTRLVLLGTSCGPESLGSFPRFPSVTPSPRVLKSVPVEHLEDLPARLLVAESDVCGVVLEVHDEFPADQELLRVPVQQQAQRDDVEDVLRRHFPLP